MELSINSKSSHLNKTTYIKLRWIGIIGQFITINSAAKWTRNRSIWFKFKHADWS